MEVAPSEALLYLFVALSHFLLIARFVLITKYSCANECGLPRAEISDSDLGGYARVALGVSLMLKRGHRYREGWFRLLEANVRRNCETSYFGNHIW